ncbi:hypothetical protein NOVO_05220 [Rickettsiales bacterium Ac37b]|nr:hypothetical protein NOVO_05220 [Rickettsiales bacterium Ac37b]
MLYIKYYKYLLFNYIGKWVDQNLEVGILCRAIIVTVPMFILAWWFNNINWQKVVIVTISVFIVQDRLNVPPLLIILHGLVIAIGFMLFFLSKPIPWLFVIICGMMAALCIFLEEWNIKLRTLGNFIFLPALYTACGYTEISGLSRLQSALMFIPYIMSALLPVLILGIYKYYKFSVLHKISFIKYMSRLHVKIEKLLLQGKYHVEPLIAMIIASTFTALFVEEKHIPQGQWLIWSASSVIAGEIILAKRKFQERFIGCLLGVPVGVILAMCTTHSEFLLNLAALFVIITLVAFKQYIVGFGMRCAGVAFIIILSGGGLSGATIRIVNVLLGGLIGFSTFLIVENIIKKYYKY